MIFNMDLGGGLAAAIAIIGGGGVILKYCLDIAVVHTVIIDVADCNRAIEEMVKTAIASGVTDDRAKAVAFYEDQLDRWLVGQGVTGNARDASVSKLVMDAVALEKAIAGALPKPTPPTL